jgi:hypothetical protein
MLDRSSLCKRFSFPLSPHDEIESIAIMSKNLRGWLASIFVFGLGMLVQVAMHRHLIWLWCLVAFTLLAFFLEDKSFAS